MTERLSLPARLDSSGAAEITDLLKRHVGNPVVADASDTSQIGALAAQALLVAAATWETAGDSFRIENISDEVRGQLATLGLADHPVFAAGAA